MLCLPVLSWLTSHANVCFYVYTYVLTSKVRDPWVHVAEEPGEGVGVCGERGGQRVNEPSAEVCEIVMKHTPRLRGGPGRGVITALA